MTPMDTQCRDLKAVVDRFQGKRVAVVGDLMLDSYVWGRVERISPEAPVPVVHVERRTSCLGGAGNVMRNVVTLGGKVAAFGVTGCDSIGRQLREHLDDYRIDTAGLVELKDRPTTEKQRIIAGSQHLLRVDYEELGEISTAIRGRLVEAVSRRLDAGEFDAVILEDYAKGLLSQEMAQAIVDAARRNQVIVALDPKPSHPMRLKGLTMMKPNLAEAHALSGIPREAAPAAEPVRLLRRMAEKIQAEWGVEYLLISLAAQGMALFNGDQSLKLIPTRAREVFDVSGAGDTVIAAATLALSTGCGGEAAAEIANHAAGIVVGKLGTVTVSREELLESLVL